MFQGFLVKYCLIVFSICWNYIERDSKETEERNMKFYGLSTFTFSICLTDLVLIFLLFDLKNEN